MSFMGFRGVEGWEWARKSFWFFFFDADFVFNHAAKCNLPMFAGTAAVRYVQYIFVAFDQPGVKVILWFPLFSVFTRSTDSLPAKVFIGAKSLDRDLGDIHI